MQTDDGSTRPGGTADPGEAKVVRLRDWLAADEEFVPFGPGADRATTAQDGAGTEPEPGAGFWDGDASLQTAVPGPAMLDEPPAAPTARARRTLHPFGGSTVRRRWLIAGLAVAGAIAAVLVSALGGGSAPRRGQVQEAALGGSPLPNVSTTVHSAGSAVRAASVAAQSRARLARLRARRAKHERRTAARFRAAAAPRRHPTASTSDSTTPAASQPVQATSAPVDTATATTPVAPTVTEPTSTTPVEAPPVTTPAPTSGGGGSSGGGSSGGGSSPSGGGSSSPSTNSPTYGPTGSLGPGSSPDS